MINLTQEEKNELIKYHTRAVKMLHHLTTQDKIWNEKLQYHNQRLKFMEDETAQ